jgi:hypothetical protein
VGITALKGKDRLRESKVTPKLQTGVDLLLRPRGILRADDGLEGNELPVIDVLIGRRKHTVDGQDRMGERENESRGFLTQSAFVFFGDESVSLLIDQGQRYKTLTESHEIEWEHERLELFTLFRAEEPDAEDGIFVFRFVRPKYPAREAEDNDSRIEEGRLPFPGWFIP